MTILRKPPKADCRFGADCVCFAVCFIFLLFFFLAYLCENHLFHDKHSPLPWESFPFLIITKHLYFPLKTHLTNCQPLGPDRRTQTWTGLNWRPNELASDAVLVTAAEDGFWIPNHNFNNTSIQKVPTWISKLKIPSWHLNYADHQYVFHSCQLCTRGSK